MALFRTRVLGRPATRGASPPVWLAGLLAVLLGCGMLAASVGAQEGGRTVAEVTVTGTVDPAMEALVEHALAEAVERDAAALVLRIDTPGGLDASMRPIVQNILAAEVPVIVHVAPDGARAASAGMFILLSGHVAAMAPQTNVGSATPVFLGQDQPEEEDVLGRKVRQDAEAYAVALAEGRGRNGDLARAMVRDAENVPASEALDRDLIDVVASDTAQLLDDVDGMRLQGRAPVERLSVAGASVQQIDVPLQIQIQQVLFNPNVAFLLLMGGFALIAVELLSPGLVGPGLFGAILLLLGLYGTAQLPVSAAGALLLAVGVGFLIAEIFVPSGGLLGIAGAAGLVGGGLLLFDGDVDALRVSLPIAAATGLGAAAFVLFAASKAVAARAAPPRGGSEDLVGRVGTVRVPLDPIGQVYVDGALWRARPADEWEELIPRERRVRVERVDGLTLFVRELEPDFEPHLQGDSPP